MVRSRSRPTSPYLTVYRLQPGSFFSIFSRITGLVALIFLQILFFVIAFFNTGSSVFVVYFFNFCFLNSFVGNFVFSSLFLLVVTSIIYHVLFGLRHIVWLYNEFHSSNLFNLYELKETRINLICVALFSVVFGACFYVLI